VSAHKSNKPIDFLSDTSLSLIAGPCVIENMDMLNICAEKLCEITSRLKIPFVFKASFDKANRSSISSYRGPGIEKGLDMLRKVKERYGVKILSDIHTPEMIPQAAEILDIVQIPAFLARQTDLYRICGEFGIPLNAKKGQFMSPHEMENAISKYRESGGKQIFITERGTFFGYGNLVVDFRSIQIIKSFGVPYFYDATHSLQLPAARGGSSGGQRQFISPLARAQVAAGADGIFMETHPDVKNALCDKENQWPLNEMAEFLKPLLDIYAVIHG